MKRIMVLILTILCMLMGLISCKNASEQPDIENDNLIEGPFTNNDSNDFTNNIMVKIDEDILETCYEYSKSSGYEIKDKENYKSVLLEKSNVSIVSIDDDNKSDMLDGDDILIIFKEIRIVIDAETGVVLGTIPYV